MQRIDSLDVLRGFALLGILLMNIQAFGLPGAAYINPTAYGNLEGINFWVWLASHLFADQKFMSIFSMLFGAGVLLFCTHLEQRGQRGLSRHYRRMWWLLVFGLIHGYLLWYGDILFSYALCGMWVVLVRNKSIKALLTLSFILLTVGSGMYVLTGLSIPHLPPEAIASIGESWAPNTEVIAKEIATTTGSYPEQLHLRAETTLFMQTYVFFNIFLWRGSAMMLLGMALFKSGFFHLHWSNRHYATVATIGLALGWGLTLLGLQKNLNAGFSLEYSMFIGSQFNYWGSALTALAYSALVLLTVKQGRWPQLQSIMSAIGRTAFSNYIMHTLLCSALFYGIGYFAQWQRWQLLLAVFAIWTLQMLVAPWYLKHYRQGPLEALWRALTYGFKAN